MSSSQFLAQIASVDRAAQVAQQPAVVHTDAPLTEEAAALPAHIIVATDPQKLNAQTPIFKCPAWADLPAKAYHLRCTRNGVVLPAVALYRYPFYLFGRSTICDYTLEHPSISSVHAAMVFHREQMCFVLVDLSTNGCRLNGRQIERRKPVPVPVGSVLRFGYSAREYELQLGAPPRSVNVAAVASGKREREMTEVGSEARVSLTRTEQMQANGELRRVEAAAPTPAVDNHPAAPHSTALSTLAEAPVADPEPAVTQEPRRLHLCQIVVKHKDVGNPVSRGRNKGEVITRSKEDACERARFILNEHAEQKAAAGATAPTDGFVPWTAEEFVQAVLTYCELSNAKKKGDLGMVTEGTYSEAFDKAAFALRRLEVSAPVETPLGIHLIFRCD